MLALAFWFLVAFGFCYVVGHARVSLGVRTLLAGDESNPLRAWFVALIECPACLGFWVGLVGGWLLPALVPDVFPRWATAPALGLATSAVGYMLGRATGWIHE